MGLQSVNLQAGFPKRADCLSASKMKKFVDESSNPDAMNFLNPDHEGNICKMKKGLSFGVLEQNSDVERHKTEWCKYQPSTCGFVEGIVSMAQPEPESDSEPQPEQQAPVQKDNSDTGVAFLSSSSSSVCCMFMMMLMMRR